MKVSDYIVDFLIRHGVTDTFGVPGGVVLDFLYSMDARDEIEPHLCISEQGAAFAACGYAQANHCLGVAYATRGPGFTNLLTAVADAYADSIPAMFITAHSETADAHGLRFQNEQELCAPIIAESVTKFAVSVDDAGEIVSVLNRAYSQAVTGRKGPVLIDILSKLWNKEISVDLPGDEPVEKTGKPEDPGEIARWITTRLAAARRPLILVGDGVNQSDAVDQTAALSQKWNIPVLSSRGAQDAGARCADYFGYIGSHGIRYSNFIFAKSDLVISLGNRMAFPSDSVSFNNALKNKYVIRIETDHEEANRYLPNSASYESDLRDILPELIKKTLSVPDWSEWKEICTTLKDRLKYSDSNSTVLRLSHIFQMAKDYIIVSDVGNNEFWISQGYELAGVSNRILYSKSFGALGCALPKAIGAYYSTGQPVLCVTGDHGFQMNIQELQTVAAQKIPMIIIVLNNHASGMIRDRECRNYNSHLIHVTRESGFDDPDYRKLAEAYKIPYRSIKEGDAGELAPLFQDRFDPVLAEMEVDGSLMLYPNLPQNRDMQDMIPELPREEYKYLNQL